MCLIAPLAAVLIGGGTASYAAGAGKSAEEVAHTWFKALQAKDASVIGGLIAIPFVTDGSEFEVGETRDRCLKQKRATSPEEARGVVECLIADKMLTDSALILKKVSFGRGSKGLPGWSRRYRAQIGDGPWALVQSTDNHGLSVSSLLVFDADQRIRAAFIRDLFED